MVDLWNPLEGANSKPSKDYYLIDETGKILNVVKNDFGLAVRVAQKLMDTKKVKIQIIPKKGR